MTSRSNRCAQPSQRSLSETDREELSAESRARKIGEMAAWIRELTAQRGALYAKLGERQALKTPSEDPDWEDLGEAFPAWSAARAGSAILLPPKPQITPSAKILQLAAERSPEPEATD